MGTTHDTLPSDPNFYPLATPPKDRPDAELCRTVYNTAFMRDARPSERLRMYLGSERRRFGIEACKTVDDVKLVRTTVDGEARKVRRELQRLDTRRTNLDLSTESVKNGERWVEISNQMFRDRKRLLSLVGEAPIARNRGGGGRPGTWATRVFQHIKVIAEVLEMPYARVLRAIFDHLEGSLERKQFLKGLINQFRQWRHWRTRRASGAVLATP